MRGFSPGAIRRASSASRELHISRECGRAKRLAFFPEAVVVRYKAPDPRAQDNASQVTRVGRGEVHGRNEFLREMMDARCIRSVSGSINVMK